MTTAMRTPEPPAGRESPPPPVPKTADQLLAQERSAIAPLLGEAVDSLPGRTRHIAGHHLGRRDEHGRPVAVQPSKAARPALVLATARARRGAPVAEAALSAAVAWI
ncbi:hypothetical protein ACWF94_11030 [Streptomyces sp. NPDC055078]